MKRPYEEGEYIFFPKTSNRFIITKRIDSGGMGIVYFARREENQELYALKTFKSVENDFASPHKLSALYLFFAWEAWIWLIIGKHPNIVQAHWFDFSELYEPFVIIELVRGDAGQTTLLEWKRTAGQLDSFLRIQIVVDFIIQTLDGLIYAKRVVNDELGISFLHRDIKPANIFLAENNIIKISDFGIVKAFRNLKDNEVHGTPPYMPPEQWEKNEQEEKTDVFALTCVLYELIAGRFPFWQNSLSALLQKLKNSHDIERKEKIKREIQNLLLRMKVQRIDNVSDHLNSLIEKGLEFDYRKRIDFVSMRETLVKINNGKKYASNISSKRVRMLAEDWNGRGMGFHQLEHYDKALVCFKNAIVLDANDPRFFLHRGNAFCKLGMNDLAIDDYKNAISLDVKFKAAYISLGSLYTQIGKYRDAEKIYKKAMKIEDDARIQWGLGIVYFMKKKYRKAENTFNQALMMNPYLAEVYLGLGNICLTLGEFFRAEEYYWQSLGLNPLYINAYKSLLNIYRSLGDVQKINEVQQILSKLGEHRLKAYT